MPKPVKIVVRAGGRAAERRLLALRPTADAAARDSSEAPAFSTSAQAVPSGILQDAVLLRR